MATNSSAPTPTSSSMMNMIRAGNNAKYPGYSHTPEDKHKLLVQTPYGRATVLRTSLDEKGTVTMRELELTDWKSAVAPNEQTQPQGPQKDGSKVEEHKNRKGNSPVRPATLFSPIMFPSVQPAVGNDVVCLYGRGRVIGIRPAEQQVAVRLSSWRLAGRSLVTCYLAMDKVQVVRDKKLYEMSVYERVEFAQELKSKTAADFVAKNYSAALHTYASAVDAVRYVQHKSDSSNEVRADLVVLMITCSNNAATCCTKLLHWDEAEKFARNTLVIIDALEPKKGKRIHILLNQSGYTDLKLFGEWRVKSCIIIAKALAEKGDSEEAIEILKTAREVIDKYTAQEYVKQPALKASIKTLVANGKEIQKLHKACKERRKVERDKEKQRARAMFGGGPSSSLSSVAEEKKEMFDSDVDSSPEKQSQKVAAAESLDPVRSVDAATPESPSGNLKKRVSFSNNDGTPPAPAFDASGHPMKKRVSFCNDPDKEFEFDKNTAADGEEPEWYQDTEVLTGLAMFAGSLGLTVLALNFALMRRR
jgi:tetratricopeptide (TPR) repeat protein